MENHQREVPSLFLRMSGEVIPHGVQSQVMSMMPLETSASWVKAFWKRSKWPGPHSGHWSTTWSC
jgi:hypothetical protein